MRKRDNKKKFYMTMILGAFAICLAHSHNVHAAELTSFTSSGKPTLSISSLIKNNKIGSRVAKRETLGFQKIQINQAADIATNLRPVLLAAK